MGTKSTAQGPSAFSLELRAALDGARCTLDEAADRICIGRRTLAYWLSGDREPDTDAEKARVLEALRSIVPDPEQPQPAPQAKPARPKRSAAVQATELQPAHAEAVRELEKRLAAAEATIREFEDLQGSIAGRLAALESAVHSVHDVHVHGQSVQQVRPVRPIGAQTYGARVVHDKDTQDLAIGPTQTGPQG